MTTSNTGTSAPRSNRGYRGSNNRGTSRQQVDPTALPTAAQALLGKADTVTGRKLEWNGMGCIGYTGTRVLEIAEILEVFGRTNRGGYDQTAFEVEVYLDPRNPDHVSTSKTTKGVLVVGASMRGVSENVLNAQYAYEADIAARREELQEAKWAISSHLFFFTKDNGEIEFRGRMIGIGDDGISVMQPVVRNGSESGEGEEPSSGDAEDGEAS